MRNSQKNNFINNKLLRIDEIQCLHYNSKSKETKYGEMKVEGQNYVLR